MKHIIIILSSALLLTSCSKTPKCWECTRTVTFTNPSKTSVSNFEKCDMNKREINDYTKINTTKTDNISAVTECH